MANDTAERLIDGLRNELFGKHNWTGDRAVKFVVPIILALRHLAGPKDAGDGGFEAIKNALSILQSDAKRELDNALNQVLNQYHDVGPQVRAALRDMIVFLTDQPDGILYDILDYLSRKPALLRALLDEDFIGTLFERSVSSAFRGDDGRFFTPRNVILIVREMMRALLIRENPERAMSSYTICDPCCGSARFLLYWAEMILQEAKETDPDILHADLLKLLKATAEKMLFGADIHEDTATYACLNMLLHGDGATNIACQDSLDHFGFFADMPLLRQFAQEFDAKWDAYKSGVGNRGDLDDDVAIVEECRDLMVELATAGSIDVSDARWLNAVKAIRSLLNIDRQVNTQWDSVRNLQRRYKRDAVFETMIENWGARNPDAANGFDVVITNPPFGRQRDLMIDDPYLLCQYRLATELWVNDMNRDYVEKVLANTVVLEHPLHLYYLSLVKKHCGRDVVVADDGITVDRLSTPIIGRLAQAHGLDTIKGNRKQMIHEVERLLGRDVVSKDDAVSIDELSAADIRTICIRELYNGTKPGQIIIDEIVGAVGRDWMTVEDIEGPGGYASKTTLVFNGESYDIYYDQEGKPIVYQPSLPKQVLFLEQFLRLAKPGGKIFTVLDVGALNNIGDEYVRQFIYRNAHVHCVVEFLHGAFKAAEANVRTAILLYEKGSRDNAPEETFFSLPQYLGFKLNDQNVPGIRENDLGKVLCDYSSYLGQLAPCQALHNDGQLDSLCKADCVWQRERQCRYWSEAVDPGSDEYQTERQAEEHDLVCLTQPSGRASQEQRLDSKYFVFERRFEQHAERLSSAGVDVKYVKEIVAESVHRGTQPDYDDSSGTISVLKTVDIQNRKIAWDECRRVPEAFYNLKTGAQLRRDDVVLTSTGEGSWGRAAIIDVDRAMADGHLAILRIDPTIVDPYAVLVFFWSDYGRMQLEQRVRGSTGQTEVYPQDIETIKVLIPSKPEQKRLRKKIKEQFNLLDRARRLGGEVVGDIRRLLEDNGE